MGHEVAYVLAELGVHRMPAGLAQQGLGLLLKKNIRKTTQNNANQFLLLMELELLMV